MRSRTILLCSLALGLLAAGVGLGFSIAPDSDGGPAPLPPEDMTPALRHLVEEHRAIVAVHPEDALAWARLGLVYAANRLDEAGLECYERAAALVDDEPLWSYHAALSTLRLGRLAETLQRLERLDERFPSFLPAAFQTGAVLLQMDRPEEARTQFRRILERDPNCPHTLSSLADVSLRLGDAAEALALAQRARASAPAHAYGRYVLGQALLRLGRAAEAQVVLESIDEPERTRISDRWSRRAAEYVASPDRQLDVVRECLEQGRTSDAVLLVERILDRNPDHLLLRSVVGGALLQANRPQEALNYLERVAAEWSEDAQAQVNLGTCLLQLGRLADAKRHAERAIRVAPDMGRAHLLRARILRLTGRPAEALESWQEAARTEPDNPGLRRESQAIQQALARAEDGAGRQGVREGAR